MPTSVVRLKTAAPPIHVNNGRLSPGQQWVLVPVAGEWRVYVRKGQSRLARLAAVESALAEWRALAALEFEVA